MFSGRRLPTLVLAVTLFFSVAAGAASPAFATGGAGTTTDPCDDTLWENMVTNANEGFQKMDTLVRELHQPPAPLQNYKCARESMDVWSADWGSSIASIIQNFFSSILGWLMSILDPFGIISSLLSNVSLTLSGASPFNTLVSNFGGLGKFSELFQNPAKSSSLVCADMWTDTLGNAMKPITFSANNNSVKLSYGSLAKFKVDCSTGKLSYSIADLGISDLDFSLDFNLGICGW